MKLLYGFPGMGNGHLTRALHLVPKLMEHATVDVLMTAGKDFHLDIPFDIKYKKKGLSFHLGSNGKIDFLRTIERLDFLTLAKDINSLPIDDYDLVITDFEPLTAWASQYRQKNSVHIGNFPAYQSSKIPRPKNKDLIGELAMKYLAPAYNNIAFSYEKYDDFILTPLIREEIRNVKVENGSHYTVYLVSFNDKFLIDIFKKLDHVQWHVFSRYTKKEYTDKNVTVIPIENEKFIKSFSSCQGIVCSTGFQTTTEALFLGKKLLTIPIEAQYEQICNAEALKRLNVKTLEKFDKNFINEFKDWEENYKAVKMDYPDNTEEIINKILKLATNK